MKKLLFTLATILMVGTVYAGYSLNKGTFEGSPEFLNQTAILTPAPIININVTEGDEAFIFEAVGEGSIRLYFYDNEVENPFTVVRTDVDQIVVLTAVAHIDGEDDGVVTAEYLVPALGVNGPRDLSGEIVIGDPDENGHVTIGYTGDEDVTITVTVNGAPVDVVDGMIMVGEGESVIVVTVSAEGYNDLTATKTVTYEPVVTEMPEITYEVTENAVVISATGEGEVLLYVDSVLVDNPCTIERRSNWEKVVIVTATAQEDGKQISETATRKVIIPAIGEPADPYNGGYWLVYYGWNGQRHYCPLRGSFLYEFGTRVSFFEYEDYGDWVFFYFLVDGVNYGPKEAKERPMWYGECVNPMFDNENLWVVPWSHAGYEIGIEFNDGWYMGFAELTVGGGDVTDTPEISWHYVEDGVEVTAVGDGQIYLYVDYELVKSWGHKVSWTIPYGDEDQAYHVSAFACEWYKYPSYPAEEIIMVPGKNNEPQDLTGEIVIGDPDENGKVSIGYTGDEDVTITVTVNGEPVDIVDGMITVGEGESVIVVTVSTEGYYKDLIATKTVNYDSGVTAMPEITYEVTENAVIITATGKGEVLLYVDGQPVDNPCTIERGGEDKVVIVTATAQEEGKEVSNTATKTVIIPAIGEPVDPYNGGFWVVYFDREDKKYYEEMDLMELGGILYEALYTHLVFSADEGFGDWAYFYLLLDGVKYGPKEANEIPMLSDEYANPTFDNDNLWVIPSHGSYEIGVRLSDLYMRIAPWWPNGGKTDKPEISWHYVENGVEVTAVGDGCINLYDDYELVGIGWGEARWTIPYGDKDEVYFVVANAYDFGKKPSDWVYETIVVPGKNNEPQDLTGEIVIGDPDENGHVTIGYTGDEDVTITVTVNGEPVDVVDGMITVGEGESVIVVTVSTEGYYKDLIATKTVTYEPGVEPEVTAMPEITYEVTENAVIITATGEGEVLLYVDGQPVDNPVTIERGGEDKVVIVTATAQAEGGLISEVATMEITIPAIGGEPEDPHMAGKWIVMTDADGVEHWYVLNHDPNGENNWSIMMTLHHQPWNLDVPFYFMVDGKRYGAESNMQVPAMGNADQTVLNPVFENENCWSVPAGYTYTWGLQFKGEEIWLLVAQGPMTGVNELNGEKAVAGVRYFNMAGQEMPEADGMTIVVTTYTDGTTNAVKVMK